ncbi:MAG: type III-B CRISPR module-associated Cmr3 family protein [Cyanobacteria bacterium J06626_18]
MSDLNWYTLDPIDLLLMREAKPFSPGDGSWAKGQFPPLPITVFQAMRSATPWVGDENNRRQKEHWLEFMGPFLLHAPPGKPETLWLPTPQDLVCVKPRKTTAENSRGREPEEDFTETATEWQRTARFQPLDPQNPAWENSGQYLGLDPDFFPADQLAPMVPPMRLKLGHDVECDLNAYLRQMDAETWEGVAGSPDPWIRADILVRYLQGEVIEKVASEEAAPCFHPNPWSTQVLPHIKVQPGTRQVADEEGYFTEVAIRMDSHWHLVAGISQKLDANIKVVRLGGEGHRVIVAPMAGAPSGWDELQKWRSPQPGHETAYVLTPGLAEATTDSELFSLIPETWKPSLRSCVGDRPLLWGGMSVFQKPKKPGQEHENAKDIAFQPQRAFVPPGTVYRFQAGQIPPEFQTSDQLPQLLPQASEKWLTTFKSLNYGILLWGQ